LKINAKEIFLILNRVNEKVDPRLLKVIDEKGFNILGIMNTDNSLIDLELEGKTVFDLPDDSKIIKQVDEVLSKITL